MKKESYDKLRIRVDYNNMFTTAVGEYGIAPVAFNTMSREAEIAFDGVEAKRSALRWRELHTSERENLSVLNETAEWVRSNCEAFVILGIGGSALGPIAVHQALCNPYYNELSREKRNGPKLYVEDNVDPERMCALFNVIDLDKTIFNVITKSGSTSETMSQLLIITRLLIDRYGEEGMRAHVIATTDKEKGNLIGIAKRYDLRTFIIPEGVGGRFSELCPVGLLAAAVCGANIESLLDGAAYMDKLCSCRDFMNNPALVSAVLEVLAMRQGANISVFMPYADSLKYMADWYAQLWAESLGKKKLDDGKMLRFGQTPVKALGVTDQHSQVQLYTDGPFDKTITFLRVENYRKTYEIPHAFDDIPSVSFLSGHTLNELITAECRATEHAVTVSGHMNKTIIIPEVNEFTIGQLIMLLEMQTAFAGELLAIDAFDQPGVEEGKNATYALLGKKGYEAKLRELQTAVAKDERFIV